MAITTDLSRRPYFDEFDANDNFHRVLFRPSTAVQTRELNEMQSILQDQVDKFGRHIFKNGSVVEGCSFTFDRKYNFVKINDTYTNNFAISTTSDFVGNYIENENGLQALIINSADGLESAAPDFNTLYVSYLNSAAYANGDPQKTFDKGEALTLYTTANVQIGNSTIEVATPANTSEASVGFGYAFTTTEGVIFKDGYFVRVPTQTILVSKYDNTPNNVSIGFKLDESIITPEADTTLLDNAAGSPNFSAPGAHRLKLVPTLEKRTTSNIDTNIFFSLCDFKNGYPVTIKNDAQYAALGAEQARRTYETNGDFVVKPFLLNTETHASNAELLNLVVSQGLGYAKGYRVEYLNNNILDLRKGTDYANSEVTITSNYENYFIVDDYVGEFDTDQLIEVELHNAFKNALTDRGFLGTAAGSTQIGTAKIRSVLHESGTPGTSDAQYKLYIFDIVMNAGYSTSDVKSVMYTSGGSTVACADIVQIYNASLGANTTRLEGDSQRTLLFRLGPKALTTNGFGSSASFSYRNKESGTILANGQITITLSSDTFPYSGTLSTSQKQEFILIPTANQVSTKTGTVNTYSNSTVTGVGTSFTSEYSAGDYVTIDGYTRRITQVSNNTHMKIDANASYSNTGATHKKIFINGVPIPLDRSARSVIVNSTTETEINLNETFDSSGTLAAVVYHKAKRSSAQPIQKDIKKARYVKIDCSNSSYGTSGPWPFGFSDVHKINAVYIGTGGVYSNTGTDYKNYFTLDNGQKDSYYAISTLKTKTNSLLSNTSTILVEFDYFDHDESAGKGFFTAASYPVYANDYIDSTHISIKDIPLYTSSKGQVYDLRDHVDFRPYAANTAVDTGTVASATVNPIATISWDLPVEGSYIPVPDSEFTTDLAYYLPRVDRVMMTTGGQIRIIEGESSLTPVPPLAKEDMMNLGTVRVTQYPTLTPYEAKLANRYDYSVTVDIKQNKRYTMRDIAGIESRINVLEYYTALNLLEKNANDLLVRSDSTGLNRFKNGFMVDNFDTFAVTNTLHPKFNISLDKKKSELRPKFKVRRFTLDFDSSKSSNVVKKGKSILLTHTSSLLTRQNFATKYRNCIEGNIYNHIGRIEIPLEGSIEPCYDTLPDVVSNLDLSQNWITLANAWETEWGTWETQSTRQTGTSSSSTSSTSSAWDYYGGETVTTTTYTTTVDTFAEQQKRIGQDLVTTNNNTSINLGQYIQSINILPYINAQTVQFYAYDLKPNTRVYLYFNDILLSYSTRLDNNSYVRRLDTSTNASNIFQNSDEITYQLKEELITDSKGRVFGVINIPPNTFKQEQSLIKILDIDDLTQGEDAITTSAIKEFYASKLHVNYASSILNVKSPLLEWSEVDANRTITYTETGTNVVRTSIYIEPPPPPEDEYYFECASCP